MKQHLAVHFLNTYRKIMLTYFVIYCFNLVQYIHTNIGVFSTF